MSFIHLSDIKQKEIVPGFKAKMVHSDHMTLAFWNIEAGATLPEHSHPNEQITTVIKGKFEMTVAGETRIMERGAVFVIPSDAGHSGKAMIDSELIDVFYPVREDYR
jgi:quercetin dioxygenase-like cupin family protein